MNETRKEEKKELAGEYIMCKMASNKMEHRKKRRENKAWESTRKKNKEKGHRY